MNAVLRTVRRIWSDISIGKNIDIYVVSVIAISLGILNLVGDIVPDSLKTTVILAALSLLVYNLSMKPIAFDEIINDRAHIPPLPEMIRGTRTLWVYGPTAANILTPTANAMAIHEEILNRADGQLRVIIQDPLNDCEMEKLSDHLDAENEFNTEDMATNHYKTRRFCANLSNNDCVGDFGYRFLKFNPGFSMIVVDPTKGSGFVIVELFGFHHKNTLHRMHVKITKQQSPKWFDYWVSQYNAMWEQAIARDANFIPGVPSVTHMHS